MAASEETNGPKPVFVYSWKGDIKGDRWGIFVPLKLGITWRSN